MRNRWRQVLHGGPAVERRPTGVHGRAGLAPGKEDERGEGRHHTHKVTRAPGKTPKGEVWGRFCGKPLQHNPFSPPRRGSSYSLTAAL